MRFNRLQDWLSWQESLNPREIDLGLERVGRVYQCLDFSDEMRRAAQPAGQATQLSHAYPIPVISVAGTNGKGSCCAFIESILMQLGLRVGCYSSPHLLRYNERMRINQQPLPDQAICEAFEQVDQARLLSSPEIPLTYFEFATLGALAAFANAQVDVVVLEVGLGGRLDAVNVVDADVSVITSIGLDHTDWLGDDLQQIAREKAGIMRPAKPCVIGFMPPQASLVETAKQLKVPLIRLGQDYLYQRLAGGNWQIKSARLNLDELPAPALVGDFQLQNAAAAIFAVQALLDTTSLAEKYILELPPIRRALQQVKLAGRYQQLNQAPEIRLDVAHNPQSAEALATILQHSPLEGKTLAVVAMLGDKAVDEVLGLLAPQIDLWFSAGLDVGRGLSAKNMAQSVRQLGTGDKLEACETVTQACHRAWGQARVSDRIIVFGSFYTVAEAMGWYQQYHRHDG